MLDVDFVRRSFPALDDRWALFDNAGGSVMAQPVIDRVGDYMARYQVQLGASYPLSVEAGERVTAGHRSVADLLGAGPDEVVIGPSSTINAMLLAQALRPLWRDGDEVVVTNLDHETNVGPWRRLEATGIAVREWRMNPETAELELDALEPLLTDRTRLVCFTHCSNIAGRIHDVAAITRRVHQAGARVCVDGVAYAPHRRVDVAALGVDFYLLSLYKTYGPHLGVLYGRRRHLLEARGAYHFFIAEDDVPYKLQPGGPNHELAAALPGLLEYFDSLDRHHFGDRDAGRATRLDRVFDLVAEHEERLVAPLLDFLTGRPGVRIVGPRSADRGCRVPLVSFVVEGREASEIPTLLDRRRLAVRWGHFYAYRAIRDLGLLDRGGVVRVSMAHYNTAAEVERLIAALDEVL